MRVANELLMAADGHVSPLVPLDLSAGFDTVHHDILHFIGKAEVFAWC